MCYITIFDNIPDYLKQSLGLQLEAARIVTGATKLTSKQLLYDETGWETLQTRRNNHKFLYFHEMLHKNAPGCIEFFSTSPNI